MNFLRKLWHNFVEFAYNEDRATASIFGAPKEETISSEIGRHEQNPVAHVAANALDAIQKNHVENAVAHADALKAADQKYYGSGGKGV